MRRDPFCINRHHKTLRAESPCGVRHKFRIVDGGRIDAHFICAGVQQLPNILNGANAPPDRERHKHVFRGPRHDVQKDSSIFMRGGNI